MAGSLASRLERGELNSNIDFGRLEKAATRVKTGMGYQTLSGDTKGSEVATRLLVSVELRFRPPMLGNWEANGQLEIEYGITGVS